MVNRPVQIASFRIHNLHPKHQTHNNGATNTHHYPFLLTFSKGSVVDFYYPKMGAIVNAANELCLGGGGVDGAISLAGGDRLLQERVKLPVLEKKNRAEIRCRTGSAVMTGPATFGSLHVDHVIHAVGPNYCNVTKNHLDKADSLLMSAHISSLDRAKEAHIESIAFSLLSAGVYRGQQSLKHVLQISLNAICNYCGYQELQSVYMIAFSQAEVDTLLEIAFDMGLEKEHTTYN